MLACSREQHIVLSVPRYYEVITKDVNVCKFYQFTAAALPMCVSHTMPATSNFAARAAISAAIVPTFGPPRSSACLPRHAARTSLRVLGKFIAMRHIAEVAIHELPR